MFRVSDKVVRIAPLQNSHNYDIIGEPMEVGRVYVVSGTEFFDFREGWADGIYVVGSEAIWKPWGQVVPWAAKYFRKLDDIKEENRLKNHDRERTPEKVS